MEDVHIFRCPVSTVYNFRSGVAGGSSSSLFIAFIKSCSSSAVFIMSVLLTIFSEWDSFFSILKFIMLTSSDVLKRCCSTGLSDLAINLLSKSKDSWEISKTKQLTNRLRIESKCELGFKNTSLILSRTFLPWSSNLVCWRSLTGVVSKNFLHYLHGHLSWVFCTVLQRWGKEHLPVLAYEWAPATQSKF